MKKYDLFIVYKYACNYIGTVDKNTILYIAKTFEEAKNFAWENRKLLALFPGWDPTNFIYPAKFNELIESEED